MIRVLKNGSLLIKFKVTLTQKKRKESRFISKESYFSSDVTLCFV